MTAPVKLAGIPTGIKRFIAELGCEVGTFIQPTEKPTLTHHVPLNARGDYRPSELANFNGETYYRTDAFGKMLCGGSRKDGALCNRRAMNRSPRCPAHGGELHPMDKIVKGGEGESLSRYKQFLAGEITAEDLDDEELACCGFRSSNGRIYKPRNIPREMAQGFQRAIYDRAQEQLRALTIDAVSTLGEIMKNKTVEPDVRLKSALSIIERNLGKTPQAVVFSQEKPFEVIFDDISHARPVESERPDIIDAIAITDGTDASSDEVAIAINEFPGSVLPQQHSTDTVANQRLFERNEAVMAQTLEIKPFEYDLSDNRKEIKKATQKRYVSRALGVDLTSPNWAYERVEVSNGDGTSTVKYVEPQQKPDEKPKVYTLSDL